MSIAEQIYEVAKPLPESLALEALHFIEYLSIKNADRAELSDLTRNKRRPVLLLTSPDAFGDFLAAAIHIPARA